MGIKFPEKTYFTFHELLIRWQCVPTDLYRVIVSGELTPSMRADAGSLSYVHWEYSPFGDLEASENTDGFSDIRQGGYSLAAPVRACWVHLQKPHQTAPFDCRFTLASDDLSPDWPNDNLDLTFAIWYWLPTAVDIANVESRAVFLLEEIGRFENKHGDDKSDSTLKHDRTELKTRERDTMLKLIIGMAVKGYNFDPSAPKSTTPKEIADDLVELEINITDDTVRKYLKQATTTILPGKPRQP